MLVTLSATVLLVLLAVLIHLEALSRLWKCTPKLPLNPRLKVGVALLGALVAHLIEIGVFAVGIRLLNESPQYGELRGAGLGDYSDYAYYSMVTYTSLGFGDILPTGPLRILAGMETLTGLVLIAWTASFMFLQMQRNWMEDNPPSR